MDFIELETFLAAAETLNLTKAAETLFVSQSTVTHRLKKLEEELQYKLFFRQKGKRSVILTLRGEEFMSIAKRWIALYQEMELLKHNVSKSLSIASVDSVILTALPPILRELSKKEYGIISQMGEAMLKMTAIVMAFSPFGIASLMATMITTLSGAMMKEILVLILALYGSGIFLLCFIYPFFIGILGKQNPLSFMKKISEPMMVAVSTTSSAATLPVSMRTAQEKLLIPESIYGFTLPLGNTCGMNGFALFLGLFCIFASNMYGYPISFSSAAQYVFLGIVLSVGAAGVKGAGIVMTTVLLETLGMPLTVIPVLAAIWPILDPMLTLLNNTSDLIGTAIISRKITK